MGGGDGSLPEESFFHLVVLVTARYGILVNALLRLKRVSDSACRLQTDKYRIWRFTQLFGYPGPSSRIVNVSSQSLDCCRYKTSM